MVKKILILSNSGRSLVNFQYHLLKDFVKYNHDVVTCAPVEVKDRSSILSILNKIGVKLIPIELHNTSLNLLHDVIIFFRLMRLIKDEAPDIVLNYRLKPIIYGSIAAKYTKVTNIYSVITGLGYVFIGESFKVKIIRLLVKLLYKGALKFNNKVFFQNYEDLNLFIDSNLVSRNQTVVVNGSGVDINKHLPLSFPRSCVFLLAARLIKDKGVYEYVTAAKQLKLRYPKARFLLAGAIDSNPTSLTQEELNLLIADGIIEYLGWVDNIEKALVMSSVFVLPSYREGTSRAVLEAMAAGRPIITTDAPGCRETVEDGVNGYLVAVKSVEQLVLAMEKFILHPELIAKMGQESRRIAEARYDVYKVNRVMLQAMNINF